MNEKARTDEKINFDTKKQTNTQSNIQTNEKFYNK